jgi:hypothetical protein
MFRQFMAQDRLSAHEDTAMVSFYKILRDPKWLKIASRLRKNSLNYFKTTCLTSTLTPFLTELTLSAAVAVSILRLTSIGCCAQFASGEDGVVV